MTRPCINGAAVGLNGAASIGEYHRGNRLVNRIDLRTYTGDGRWYGHDCNIERQGCGTEVVGRHYREVGGVRHCIGCAAEHTTIGRGHGGGDGQAPRHSTNAAANTTAADFGVGKGSIDAHINDQIEGSGGGKGRQGNGVDPYGDRYGRGIAGGVGGNNAINASRIHHHAGATANSAGGSIDGQA